MKVCCLALPMGEVLSLTLLLKHLLRSLLPLRWPSSYLTHSSVALWIHIPGGICPCLWDLQLDGEFFRKAIHSFTQWIDTLLLLRGQGLSPAWLWRAHTVIEVPATNPVSISLWQFHRWTLYLQQYRVIANVLVLAGTEKLFGPVSLQWMLMMEVK